MKTIAIFGDVGGHFLPFEAGLESIGVDTDSGVVPKDLIVCQLGDLIHKGPNSRGTVALADLLLKNSPDNYIQLLGNHEGQYLGGPTFWQQFMDSETVAIIGRWYEAGQASIAASFETEEYGPLLATHAGLTVEFWDRYLRCETDVAKAAVKINSLPPEVQFKPGYMLGGGPSWEGGPAWAHVSFEMYLPWDLVDEAQPPFAQIHGHNSAMWWNKSKWSDGMQHFGDRCEVDAEKRHTILDIKGKKFIGIDPNYGRRATQVKMHPFIVHGEKL